MDRETLKLALVPGGECQFGDRVAHLPAPEIKRHRASILDFIRP